MASYGFKRIGAAKGVTSTYVSVGACPTGSKWQGIVRVTNSHVSASAIVEVYVADPTWTTGQPAAGTLIATLTLDVTLGVGEFLELQTVHLETNEKIVVQTSAGQIDVEAHGTEEAA